jgi:hypothetical protein
LGNGEVLEDQSR